MWRGILIYLSNTEVGCDKMPMAAGVPCSPNANVSQASPSHFENVNYAFSQVPSPDNINMFPSGGPFLFITEQPKSIWRYRYLSEKGSHGPLPGCTSTSSEKKFPTVKVLNFPENSEIHVKASLWTTDKSDLHVHKLYGPSCSDDGTCTVKVNEDGTAVFQDMTILFVAKKEVPKILFQRMLEEKKYNGEERAIRKSAEEKAKAMNLNSVRLRFDAFAFNYDKCVSLCSPEFSEPVANLRSTKDGGLKICRISRITGAASGGDEVFLLCCKVDKKDINIRFYEDSSSWEDFGIFTEADVHQQCAIVFKTPPYHRLDITDEVKVLLQLQRGNGASDPVEFTYIPCYPDEKIGMKRKKMCVYQEFGECGSNPSRKFGAQCSKPVLQSQNSPMSSESVNETSLGSSFSEEDLDANLASLTELSFEMLDLDVFNVEDSASEPSVVDSASPIISGRDPLLSEGNVQMPRWNLHSGLQTDAAALPKVKSPANVENKSAEKYTPVNFEEIDAVFGQMHISEKSTLRTEDRGTTKEETVKDRQNASTAPPKMRFQPTSVSDTALKRVWYSVAIAVIRGTFDFLRYIPQVIGFSDEERNTLLHVAVSQQQPRADIIDSLLRTAEEIHIPLVNCTNIDHKTPLHIAIQSKNPSIVRLLLKYGADPSVINKQGFSSYHLAIYVKSKECLGELLQKMNYKSLPETFNLNCTDYQGLAPLHYAVERELVECITLLCLNGADVNIKSGKDGRTPLHYAARQDSKVAKILLAMKSTDVNAQDYAGNTPLQLACSENNLNVVRLLMAHGADPFVCSYESDEFTAFHFAEGNQEIRDILMDSCNPEKLRPELKLQAASSAPRTSSVVHPQNSRPEVPDKNLEVPNQSASGFTPASEGDSGYLSGKLSVLNEAVVEKLSNLLDPPSDLWKQLMMVTIVDPDFERNIHKLTSKPTKAILKSFLNSGGTVETLVIALEAAQLYQALDIVVQHISD